MNGHIIAQSELKQMFNCRVLNALVLYQDRDRKQLIYVETGLIPAYFSNR